MGIAPLPLLLVLTAGGSQDWSATAEKITEPAGTSDDSGTSAAGVSAVDQETYSKGS